MNFCQFEKNVKKSVSILFEQSFLKKHKIVQVQVSSFLNWKLILGKTWGGVERIKRNMTFQLYNISKEKFLMYFKRQKTSWNNESHSSGQMMGWAYTICSYGQIQISCITLPTQSCLVWCSLCANLLHSLIMWLIVSSQLPHNLHLLFCYVISVRALIWLVLISLFCAAIRRDSVSLLRFPFLSHVHVFLWTLISRFKCSLSCFSSHFCFLINVVLLVLMLSVFVSDGCNKSSSTLEW